MKKVCVVFGIFVLTLLAFPVGVVAAGPGCDDGSTCTAPRVSSTKCSPVCGTGKVCCDDPPSQGTSCNSGKGTCKPSCSSLDSPSSDPVCVTPTPSCCTPPSTTPTPSPGASITFDNPLSYNTVEQVLTALLDGLQGIIVTLALVFLVVGAVLYVTSAGNEKQIETAKNAIYAAMIGLALGIAAPSFLKEIATILGWGSVPVSVSASASITTILLNVLNFLLNILGVLAIVMMVIGGFMYLTSAGDEDRIDRGKKILIWSIVGVIVALASLIIVRQIADFFDFF